MTTESRVGSSMVWWGWGTAEGHAPLPDSIRGLLSQALGIDGEPTAPGAPPTPAPSRLAQDARTRLEVIVGPDACSTTDADRVAHTRGKSTPDLLKIRGGDLTDAPDAVLTPASHDDVLAILATCTEENVAVVPFGGGTSVVGGLAPEADGFAATIALDLRRMDALVRIDETSMTATFQPGVRGPAAEALLAPHGLTLGHFPQSFEHASLGGYAATRSSGQASAGYGRFDQMIVALTLATPTGTWTLGRGPHNAAGPDLRHVAIGSEGAFGVVTEVTVAVRAAPAVRRYEGWQVPSFAEGVELLRALAQGGALPTIARLSDEMETGVGLANAKAAGEQTAQGCYVMLGFEGTAEQNDARRAAAAPVLKAAGASSLGDELGDQWLEGRFHGPYLRDALLDVGGLVETVETTTDWAALPGLYEAVRAAAVESLSGAGTPAIVLCHISHVYRTGASLYFTIVCKQADDPLAQWAAAKQAIGDAIVGAGGSITHHHAVGTDHRPWLGAEVGDVGLRVLRAIKDELDPAGILNPGVLVARADD
ncbi:MAG: FAD-binding oxidoreductase [Solirubrobacteraceae bacterium]|nr:FAD-binding oxidoreductase [Solirubrobacteraceae bacterium]